MLSRNTYFDLAISSIYLEEHSMKVHTSFVFRMIGKLQLMDSIYMYLASKMHNKIIISFIYLTCDYIANYIDISGSDRKTRVA